MHPYLSYFLKIKYDFLSSLLKSDDRAYLTLDPRSKRPRACRAPLHIVVFLICYLTQGCAQPVSSQPSTNVSSSAHPASRPTSLSHQTQSIDSRSNASSSTMTTKWGRASFGQPVYPETLHQESENRGVAIFAGGCFWCMEAPFESLPGVVAVYSGYTGGSEQAPTYSQVSASRTQHLEAVLVYYRPQDVSYQRLVDRFWRSINPTQDNGQFADIGLQYTTAIFAIDHHQHQVATQSKDTLSQSGKFSKPIAVKILKSSVFWPAEGYHQDYYKTNPAHYNRYKYGSGRAGYLKKTWGE